MHSEGILAGELKHGPLALIDNEMPIIMVVANDHTYEKCLSAVQQVTARSVRLVYNCTSTIYLDSVYDRVRGSSSLNIYG